MIFALLTFVGFSVITTAAEETNSPREIIPRIVIVGCVLLGLFWAVTAWPLSLSLRDDVWDTQTAQGLNPVAVISRQYWGSGSIVVTLTALSAVLGVYLASVVGYARIVFAMGRDGTMPGWFARLHPKYQVPWNAQHVVLAVTVALDAIWARWLGVYMAYDWWGTAVVFFAMIANIFVNVGCTAYFYRFRREIPFIAAGTSWFPFLGIVTSVDSVVLLIRPRSLAVRMEEGTERHVVLRIGNPRLHALHGGSAPLETGRLRSSGPIRLRIVLKRSARTMKRHLPVPGLSYYMLSR